MKPIYGIEVIGCGKRRRYALKLVDERGTLPIDFRTYQTEDEARRASKELGRPVSVVGNFYEIVSFARREAQR